MPEVVASYEYRDEQERLLYVVERLRPKGFRQYRIDEDGAKVYALGDVRRVLYQLSRVLAAVREGKWVWVVEGEKDVHSLEEHGCVATTSPGGAGKWRDEYAEALRGAKVAIVADADEAGRRHALTVACSLDGKVEKLILGEPAPGHKDISSHLQRGKGLRDIVRFDRAAVQAALHDGTAKKRNGVISARDFCARPGMNGDAQVLGPALWRTMRCTIGAATGDGKTTLGVQMVRAVVCGEEFLGWRGKGGRALVVDVEQGEETLKQRLRELGLDDNPNVDLLWEPDGYALDSDEDDRRHVESVLKDGKYAVALFDPLYQLHHGDQNSERTAADVMRLLDGWTRRFELALITPMHRRKTDPRAGQRFTKDDIAGNGAWVRNSEIIFGLQILHAGRSRLHFFKDRPGHLPGVGSHTDLLFDTETHRFSLAPRDEEKGWRLTVDAVRTADEPPTTAELAGRFGVTVGTIHGHLRGRAYCDNEKLAVKDRRWQIEPWVSPQLNMEEVA